MQVYLALTLFLKFHITCQAIFSGLLHPSPRAFEIFLLPMSSDSSIHVLSCLTSCVGIVLCPAGLKSCWTRDGHPLYKWSHSSYLLWFSPIFLVEVVEGRVKPTWKQAIFYEGHHRCLKSSREDVLEDTSFYVDTIKFWTLSLTTRKQLIIYIFLHGLDNTCICSHHQLSTVTTFETGMENQCSWHVEWYRLMSHDVTSIK